MHYVLGTLIGDSCLVCKEVYTKRKDHALRNNFKYNRNNAWKQYDQPAITMELTPVDVRKGVK